MGRGRLKTIGILGGMGPAAGVYLHHLLIKENRFATKDQDHPPVLHFANSQIPSRMDYALGKGGPSPLPEIIHSLEVMEKAGADLAIIACNTAHLFIDEIQAKVNLTLINIIQETARCLKSRLQSAERVALLATTPTIEKRIYHRYFSQYQIELTTPDNSNQEKVMMAIFHPQYGLKAKPQGTPEARGCLHQVVESVCHDGNRAVVNSCALIEGCTELSGILKTRPNEKFFVIDPLEIVAEVALGQAGVKLN